MNIKIFWRGIFKLQEEMAELGTELGKAGAFPVGPHPDGKGDLKSRIEDEVADVYAALDYLVDNNDLSILRVTGRRVAKLKQYETWGLSGVPAVERADDLAG